MSRGGANGSMNQRIGRFRSCSWANNYVLGILHILSHLDFSMSISPPYYKSEIRPIGCFEIATVSASLPYLAILEYRYPSDGIGAFVP